MRTFKLSQCANVSTCQSINVPTCNVLTRQRISYPAGERNAPQEESAAKDCLANAEALSATSFVAAAVER